MSFWRSKKKRKPSYEFDTIDRELADQVKHNKKLRQIEKLRALQGNATEKLGSPLLQQLQELREVAEELGYVKDNEGGSDTEMIELMKQLLPAFAGKQPVPMSPDVAGVGATMDATEQIISRIPDAIQAGIKTGKISKTTAEKYAVTLAKKEFSKVWKRLKGTSTNK